MPNQDHFKIRTRGRPEEVGYILQSSEDDFMYDVVDADVRIEIDGALLFPPGSHRISEDGFMLSVPILVFAWNLVAAAKRLSASSPAAERVAVTSTDYVLEFERQNDWAKVRVRESGRAGKVLAETGLTLRELQRECKSVGELGLAAVFRENPALKGNPHLKRFASEIEMLDKQMKR